MYLFRPGNWFRRAEAFGEEGDGGLAAHSGAGNLEGTMDRGVEREVTGGRIAGSTGSILLSGSTSGSGNRSTLVMPASQLESYSKGVTLSSPSSSYYGGRCGSSRPLITGYALLFGFWPLIWSSAYPEGALPTNNTRPGGNLISAAIIPPVLTTNITYVIYGDQQSVEDLLPALIESCSAVNAVAGFGIKGDSTIQMYREDSFELLEVGTNDTQVGRNMTFEYCLNQTIMNNILVVDNPIPPQPSSPDSIGNGKSSVQPSLPIETNEGFFLVDRRIAIFVRAIWLRVSFCFLYQSQK